MWSARTMTVVALLAGACTSSGADGGTGDDSGSGAATGAVTSATTSSADGSPTSAGPGTTSATTTTTTASTGAVDGSSTGAAMPDGPRLEVRFLGVGGFSFRHEGDLALTAPMYTNPDMLAVQFGQIASEPAIVDQFLADDFVADAAAILVGHAHYDHLLDVPHIWTKTDGALVLGNDSMKNLMLSAGLPDTAVLAFDDPADPWVDSRSCPDPNPCTGVPTGNVGAWLEVPGTNLRTLALCSMHPDQVFGAYHFAEGCVDDVPPMLPTAATEWKEGATLAWLVDYLDPVDMAPVFRVYAQDAPTDAPIGHVPADVLAEKRIDLAVLNVGSYDAVGDHPTAAIAAHSPRYVLAGHWENFFRPQDQPIEPIPFQAAPEPFDDAALAAIGDAPELPVEVDGVLVESRYFRPVPGTDFVFWAE
jgi:L-ascorbate metabolism protein UlaG (beta-lactamase superfamily)